MIETDYYGSIIWDTNVGGWIELYSTIDVKLSKNLVVEDDITITHGNFNLPDASSKIILSQENDAVSPTLQFGDGDTGFYESVDDTLQFVSHGAAWFSLSSSGELKSGAGTRWGIVNEDPSDTNPVFLPSNNDPDTGIGHAAADALSLIAGGIEGHRITEDTGAITHELTGTVQGDDLNNYMVQKATFDILGLMTDPRLLTSLECTDPGAGTLPDVSGQGHDGTYNGAMTTTDRLKKNMGWVLDPDGDDYIEFADHNDFSFGDGTNDEAFTIFGIIDLTAGVIQTLMSKYDGGAGVVNKEWICEITADLKPNMRLFDHSADVTCSRLADNALSEGLHLICITYDGTGGGVAGNTIKIYVDGVLVASTATNDGAYVAMENRACLPYIGCFRGTSVRTQFIRNNFGCIGLDGSEWTSYTVHRFHQLIKGIYGL